MPQSHGDHKHADMKSRTDELNELMRRHKLSARSVGELLGRTPHTVRVWRCISAGRPIPRDALELLQLKLKERSA